MGDLRAIPDLLFVTPIILIKLDLNRGPGGKSPGILKFKKKPVTAYYP